ncbi:MAG: hypothetical protein RIT27_2231 [Pseudomonadota bacterium]|jgi:lipoprotein-releasing system ATP-binding protein
MNKLVLQCKNVSKSFRDAGLSVDVLSDINLSISMGERIAIVGSSGSGKSTLLHLLGGLEKPTQGEVWVMEKNLSNLNEAEKGTWRNKTLGFIYQFHHLLPEFTALENVAMPLLIRNTNPADAKIQAFEILEKVGLSKRVDHKPGEMSGGERQRAAIARALVTKPRCVLADEPTGNLDRHTADQVYETMLELNAAIETSLVVVTHDETLAQRMDKIYHIKDGKLQIASPI